MAIITQPFHFCDYDICRTKLGSDLAFTTHFERKSGSDLPFTTHFERKLGSDSQYLAPLKTYKTLYYKKDRGTSPQPRTYRTIISCLTLQLIVY